MLHAVLHQLPPSVNKLYTLATKKTKTGKIIAFKRLSDEAQKYITWASTELGKSWAFQHKLDPNRPHSLTLKFFLPKVEHAGWPAKAKSRFVKRDVTNLIKILEDIIAKASGVDDSATFELDIQKRLSEDSPRVEISLRELPKGFIDEVVKNDI